VNDLNKLLDALVPLAKFRKLKEFINLKLPPGFPCKIGFVGFLYYVVYLNICNCKFFIFVDIPIVPAISAKVCFQNFKKQSPSEHLFQVPSDYKEELLIDKANDSSSLPTNDSTSNTVL